MSGSLSKTDEMFVLLNRLAADPDEEAQQSLLPDSLVQRKGSLSQQAKSVRSSQGGNDGEIQPRCNKEGFLQVMYSMPDVAFRSLLRCREGIGLLIADFVYWSPIS